MDKAEYRIKLDEINSLADSGDYKKAAAVADEVEWKRVKSVRTLCMISEVYEANNRLEDSRRILEIAYRRASISKTVLYRLAETCIRLGDFDAALDYYTEFVEVSPSDSSQYVLKYKLYKARKSPLEDQIAILEEYKEREYTEKWAYELARLYAQNGQKDKCIEECDDLILWFSEGKYVTKAMELKMKYAPLSPSQKERYDNRFDFLEEELEKKKEVQQEQTAVATDPVVEQATGVMDERDEMPSISTEEAIAKMDQAASSAVIDTPELKIPPVMPVSTPVAADSNVTDPVKLQSQLADSIRQVLSGIQHKPVAANLAPGIEPEPMEAEIKETEDLTGYQVKELEPEVMAGEAPVAQASAAPAKTGTSEEQIAGQMSLADFVAPEPDIDLDALISETSSSLAEQVATGEFEKTDTLMEEKEAARKEAERKAKEAEEEAARQEEAARIAAEEAAAQKAKEEAEATRIAAEEEVKRKAEEEAERIATEKALQFARETDESLGLTREFNFQQELKKAMEEGRVPAESASIIEEVAAAAPVVEAVAPEIPVVEDAIATEELPTVEEESPVQEEAVQETIEEESPAQEVPTVEEIPTEPESPAEEDVPVERSTEEAPAVEETVKEAVPVLEQEVIAPVADMAVAEPEPAISEALVSGQTTELPVDELAQLEATLPKTDDAERMKYVPVEPRPFSDVEKKVFSYFSPIPGMSQQITTALAEVHNNAGDKTSKAGNVLIIGRQGSGKTRIADGLVRAICSDLGIEAVKIAKVIARDFNGKDPAAVVAKLSGGFLLIEGAGELSAESVDKLSRAMEFRTDSLVVILEDEKADLMEMLNKYPTFAEKFTATISVPVFTNDELVTFAKAYATENGYRMDEMGVLALYTMIGNNQKDAEPVTVGRVREMVDTAIERANKGTRKFGRKFSKKAVDEDNRIILFEKDFDFD